MIWGAVPDGALLRELTQAGGARMPESFRLLPFSFLLQNKFASNRSGDGAQPAVFSPLQSIPGERT